MENARIADALEEMATLLEIKGANPFRVRAYRNAARVVGSYGEPMRKLVAQDADLTRISGVGNDIATTIRELVATGRLEALEALRQEIPTGLLEFVNLPAVGPKKARALWQGLGVTTLRELEAAARQGKIAKLANFGSKSEQKILAAIAEHKGESKRFRLPEAAATAEALVGHLRALQSIERIEVAGSFRRRKATVGDLDILVTTTQPQRVMERFVGWKEVQEIVSAGSTRSTVLLRSGLQVDVRVVEPKSFGAALMYFTGSKAHNIKIRRRALDRQLSVSEYGVFELQPTKKKAGARSEGRWVAGSSEAEIYTLLDLAWIPPELREDRGEVEAAEARALPALVSAAALQGDAHVALESSGDIAAARRLLDAVAERGYRYVGLVGPAGQPANRGLISIRAELDELAERLGLRVFRGLDAPITKDGQLRLADAEARHADIIFATLTEHFELEPAAQTERIVRALADPRVHALAQPLAPAPSAASALPLDFDAILQQARDAGVALEIRGHPGRTELAENRILTARRLDVPTLITSGATRPDELDYIHFGLDEARRGWLEAAHVINTQTAAGLAQRLRAKPVQTPH